MKLGIFTPYSCSDDKEMYKKAWCTCKVVVLRNKPIAFLTFSLPSPLSLLKLPIYFPDGPNRCSHGTKEWHKTNLLRDASLSRSVRRGAAQLHAVTEIARATTVLVCKRKPYPVWFSWQRKSYPLGSLSNNVFERRTSTGSGLFFIFWRWFRANFQSNRLYNSKEAKEYKFYIIKAC